MQEKKTFHAAIDQLPLILQWVREKITKNAFSASDRKKIELAVEEVVVNIIEHAYKHVENAIYIEIVEKQDCIVVIIKDTGPAFNPVEAACEKQEDQVLEKVEEGGKGLVLLKHCMDALSYQRDNTYNVLTMTKYKR